MDRKEWLRKDLRHNWHPYTQMSALAADPPLQIDRAEGLFLFDADGNRYYDAISSWWCVVHGHGHPRIREAVARQMERLDHVLFAGVTHEPAVRLAARLAAIVSPPSRSAASRASTQEAAHSGYVFPSGHR